jgi:hypothetical protein
MPQVDALKGMLAKRDGARPAIVNRDPTEQETWWTSSSMLRSAP